MNRETIARIAHDINRAYCEAIGDTSQPTWDNAPGWQKQSALNGVDLHLANPNATPEQSHANWLKQKAAEGWSYGPVKDPERKEHPCFLPYDQLPLEQKVKDYLFRAVVHAVKDLPGTEQAAAIDNFKHTIDQQAATIERLRREVLEAASQAASVGRPTIYDQYVQYIGRRESFTDTIYGSNLTFTQGQARAVDSDLAIKLLRHQDLFRRYKPEEEGAVEQTDDDTQKRIEEAKAERAKVIEEQNNIAELIDQVNQMTKASLAKFAFEKWHYEFKSSAKLPEMREQVVNFIHQFGVV